MFDLYQSQDACGRETDLGHVEDVLESPIFYLSYPKAVRTSDVFIV